MFVRDADGLAHAHGIISFYQGDNMSFGAVVFFFIFRHQFGRTLPAALVFRRELRGTGRAEYENVGGTQSYT